MGLLQNEPRSPWAIAADLVVDPRQAETKALWRPLPHQVPPKGRWRGWILRAGRGSGKTEACARYVSEHVKGPPCMPGSVPHWIGIIAPTLGDAATACFSGPSGIRAHDPTARLTSGTGGLAIKWTNGSEAKLFGAHTPEDVERLRAGGNRCLVWMEELAAWRHLEECYDHMRFGLRVGDRPHWIASTTPKPRQLIKKMISGEDPRIVSTHASTYDNPHLEQDVRNELEETYGGTTLGAQELLGEIIEQDENALWKRDQIEDDRWKGDLPTLKKISVGVDPSGGAGEQGIVVVGKQIITVERNNAKQREIHGFVLADYSCRLPPAGWGRRAVTAAIDLEADDIVVETNYGGDMAIAVIRGAADDLGVSIPVKKVIASRGKRVRAEPVAALSTRGKWHHAGRFPELEDQMCTWTPDADYSPDRLDAMVWPAWHQKMVGIALVRAKGSYAGGSMNTRIA